MKNRIAIITGASSGIGEATALRFAEKGVRMVLNGRDQSKLQQVQQKSDLIGKDLISRVVSGDISSGPVTEACIAACMDAWNQKPDIFVACAGRGLPGTVLNSDAEAWSDLLNTNISGLMYQLKGIGQAMLEMCEAGRDTVNNPLDIVVIGSNIGRNVSPFNSVYGATKFAAHGLTEALRRQLAPHGIRVTLVEPGIVQTNFQEAAGYNMDWFDKYAQEVGPILKPDDVAAIISMAISFPGNVHLDNISIRPTRQAYP